MQLKQRGTSQQKNRHEKIDLEGFWLYSTLGLELFLATLTSNVKEAHHVCSTREAVDGSNGNDPCSVGLMHCNNRINGLCGAVPVRIALSPSMKRA